MSKSIRIRKGLDIKLQGEADKVLVTPELPEIFALKPTDFHGLTPKMVVKVGDKVKAGTTIFYDKYNEAVKFTSPVSGEIASIERGEKRKILEVRILPDATTTYESFKTGTADQMSKEDIIQNLLASGIWPSIRMRPIDIVANPTDSPKAIFISGFDSNPLAPDSDYVLHGNKELFQLGLDMISKLTDGKTYLTLNASAKHDEALTQAKGVEINKISGPHPAGNVGTQIHHIDPINKGEIAWYIGIQDVLTIGRLFKTGKYDASRIVTISGTGVKTPKYYKIIAGSSLKGILSNALTEGTHRVVSGSPISGDKIEKDGFLGYYHYQVCVIPEGNEPKFFLTKGWLGLGLKRKSLSKSFPSWLTPNKKYNLDTNANGEERAFVVSGQYDKVFPFDIYPVQLVKSIITNDIDSMENLGIYEVGPEDFALCEYVCTSKIDVQDIVRDGLDVIYKECM